MSLGLVLEMSLDLDVDLLIPLPILLLLEICESGREEDVVEDFEDLKELVPGANETVLDLVIVK